MLKENDGRGATGVGEAAGLQPGRGAANFRKFRKADATCKFLVVIGIVVVITAGIAQASAWGDEPCPASQIVQDLRSQHARMGRKLSDEFYRREEDKWIRDCYAANKKISDLAARLAELDSTKEMQRDRYIILKQLLDQYALLRATTSPKAKEIAARRDEILSKNPVLKNLSDFRLTKEIEEERASAKRDVEARGAAKNWVPQDNVPIRVLGSDRNVVVQYQYKLKFVQLPADVELRKNKSSRLRIYRGESEVNADAMAGKKTMTFQRPIMLPPDQEDDVSANLLVCTPFWYSDYVGMTPLDEEMIRQRGGATSIPWTNKSASHEQFCGVLSNSGQVVYEFPVRQRAPATVLYPLAMDSDGKRALVAVGSVVRQADEDGERDEFGSVREVLEWKASGGLVRKPVPQGKSTHDLRREFFSAPK